MRETYSCGGPRRDGNRYRLLERERHTLQRLRQLRTCRRCCRETPTQYARQSSRGSVVFLRRSSSSSSSSSSCRLRIRRPPEQISSIIIISRERDPSSSCADHHHRHRLGERGIHSLLAQIVVIIIIILPGKIEEYSEKENCRGCLGCWLLRSRDTRNHFQLEKKNCRNMALMLEDCLALCICNEDCNSCCLILRIALHFASARIGFLLLPHPTMQLKQ
ncbi:hypothetical protein CY35_17G080500 [Sphagnum magellanicum]|nr:hypothetical protein CY35_17G080500 [Sphagnum magellanicum]KAH9535963.1 hypothetical protein CY35_17G080500 [Sphagnum magellanicum]